MVVGKSDYQKALKNGLDSRSNKDKRRFSARGKRYSPAIKKEVLELAKTAPPEEVSEKYGVSPSTVLRWIKEAERRGSSVTQTTEAEKSDSQELRRAMILATWKEHQATDQAR